MNNVLRINMKEDESVNKKLEITAKNLQNKYNKKRKINEKRLKERTPLQNALSVIFDCFCALLVVLSSATCFSAIFCRFQNVAPSFAGYSVMQVVSGSMVKSGFNIGDTVVVKSVDTKTLKDDVIIAFYAYGKSYNSFDINSCSLILAENIPDVKYQVGFLKFFGIQSGQIREAAKAGATLVFHHIKSVYEDDSGKRWFETYGSSNASKDVWFISEDMVVGAYDNSPTAVFMAGLLNVLNSSVGLMVIILVPLLLIAVIIILECLKDVQLAFLELDVIEEKRKLTDEICVKNEVGFGMSKKAKYKVLALAKPNETNLYVSLLWKDGTAPESIRKYYLRKVVLLKANEKLRDVNRTCEQMFKDNIAPYKIAKYYETEKKKIEKERIENKRTLKALRKKYNPQ